MKISNADIAEGRLKEIAERLHASDTGYTLELDIKPWIEDVSYVPIKELKEEDFGSAQGSLIDVINTF